MRVFALLAAALGLAACTQTSPPNPLATTVPTPAAPGATPSTLSAQPPDDPTGSQRYQSPDLPTSYRPPGGL